MPCFRPLTAWFKAERGPSGKFGVTFRLSEADPHRPLTLPCGQCVGCRLRRSAEWAIRCVHESKLYENNCFITLTYNDSNLPPDGSLDHAHWQLFMKRMKSYYRRRYGSDRADGIRFYMCGEYGPSLGRPHYHACLFNHDFEDKKYKRVNRLGQRIYTSEILDQLWGKADAGMCEIGAVTIESASYVARYIMDKITGDDAVAHYGNKRPEYTKMSTNPGIGKAWFDKYRFDWYARDKLVHDGVSMPIPRYYENLFELFSMDLQSERLRGKLHAKRVTKARKSEDKFRLRDREIVQQARIKSLKRGEV